jgi:hypothetical protein
MISSLGTLISELISLFLSHTHIYTHLDVGNSVPEISMLGEFTSNLQERTFHELISDTHPSVYELKQTVEARGHFLSTAFYVIAANLQSLNLKMQQ